jgi:hypothetical protein
MKEFVEILHPHYPHTEYYIFDNDIINLKIGLFHSGQIHLFTEKVKFNGIYFLFYEKELMYIGQSNNITKRLRQHKSIKFHTYGMIILQDVENLVEIEKEFIQLCNPRLNKNHNKI